MTGIQWGYSMNQWNTWLNTLRLEEIERAFKVVSVCGFSGIELQVGTGRWSMMGRPELIERRFGSQERFNLFLHECNLDKVVSWYYDPGSFIQEENTFGRDPADPKAHAGIIEAVEPFARYLQGLGGSFIVVRPMLSYWQAAPVTGDKIRAAAACWNKVGRMTGNYGIKVLLDPDFLCAIRSVEDLDHLLAETDPAYVGLAINTADFKLAGMDPVAVFEKHADRVSLFYFKDVQVEDTLSEYKLEHADSILNTGGQRKIERWFWEMGRPEGLVDFPALFKSIKAHSFDGWIMAESDQSPNPAESAMLNCWYIRHELLQT